MPLSNRSVLSWEPTPSLQDAPPSVPNMSSTASTAAYTSAGHSYAHVDSYGPTSVAGTMYTFNTSTSSAAGPAAVPSTLPGSDTCIPSAGFPYRWMAGLHRSTRSTLPTPVGKRQPLLTRCAVAPMLPSTEELMMQGSLSSTSYPTTMSRNVLWGEGAKSALAPGTEPQSSFTQAPYLPQEPSQERLRRSPAASSAPAAVPELTFSSSPPLKHCTRRSGVGFIQEVQSRCKAATFLPQFSHAHRSSLAGSSTASGVGVGCAGLHPTTTTITSGGSTTAALPLSFSVVGDASHTSTATASVVHPISRELHWTEGLPLGCGALPGLGALHSNSSSFGGNGVVGSSSSSLGNGSLAGRYRLYSSSRHAIAAPSPFTPPGAAARTAIASTAPVSAAGITVDDSSAALPPQLDTNSSDRAVRDSNRDEARQSSPALATRPGLASSSSFSPSSRRGAAGEETAAFLREQPEQQDEDTTPADREASPLPAVSSSASSPSSSSPSSSSPSASPTTITIDASTEQSGEFGLEAPSSDHLTPRAKTGHPFGSSVTMTTAVSSVVSLASSHTPGPAAQRAVEHTLHFQEPVSTRTASSYSFSEADTRDRSNTSSAPQEPPALSVSATPPPPPPQPQHPCHQQAVSSASSSLTGAPPTATFSLRNESPLHPRAGRVSAIAASSLTSSPFYTTATATGPPLARTASAPQVATYGGSPAANTTSNATTTHNNTVNSSSSSGSNYPHHADGSRGGLTTISPTTAASASSLATPLVFHAMPTPAPPPAAVREGATEETSGRPSTRLPPLPTLPDSEAAEVSTSSPDWSVEHAPLPQPRAQSNSFATAAATTTAAASGLHNAPARPAQTTAAGTPGSDAPMVGPRTDSLAAVAGSSSLSFPQAPQPWRSSSLSSSPVSGASAQPMAGLTDGSPPPPPPPSTQHAALLPPALSTADEPRSPSWLPASTAPAPRAVASIFAAHPLPSPLMSKGGSGPHVAAAALDKHVVVSSPNTSLQGSPNTVHRDGKQRWNTTTMTASKTFPLETLTEPAAKVGVVPTDEVKKLGDVRDKAMLMVVPAGIASSWSAAVTSTMVVAPNRFSWATTAPPDAAFALVEYESRSVPGAPTGSRKNGSGLHNTLHGRSNEHGGGSGSCGGVLPATSTSSCVSESFAHGRYAGSSTPAVSGDVVVERVVTYFPVHTEVIRKQSFFFAGLFGHTGSPYVHGTPDEYVDLADLPQSAAQAASPQDSWRVLKTKSAHFSSKGDTAKTTRFSSGKAGGATHSAEEEEKEEGTTEEQEATAEVAGASPTRVPVYYIRGPGCDDDDDDPFSPEPWRATRRVSADGAVEDCPEEVPRLSATCVAQLIHYLYTGALPLFQTREDVQNPPNGVLNTTAATKFAQQIAAVYSMAAYTSLSSLTQALLNVLWRLLGISRNALPMWTAAVAWQLPDVQLLCEQWMEQHVSVFLRCNTRRGLWRGLRMNQVELLVNLRAAAIHDATKESEEKADTAEEAPTQRMPPTAHPSTADGETSTTTLLSVANTSVVGGGTSGDARGALTTAGAAPLTYGWTTYATLPPLLATSTHASTTSRETRHSRSDGESGTATGDDSDAPPLLRQQQEQQQRRRSLASASAPRARSPLRPTRNSSTTTPVSLSVPAAASSSGRRVVLPHRDSPPVPSFFVSMRQPYEDGAFGWESPTRSPARQPPIVDPLLPRPQTYRDPTSNGTSRSAQASGAISRQSSTTDVREVHVSPTDHSGAGERTLRSVALAATGSTTTTATTQIVAAAPPLIPTATTTPPLQPHRTPAQAPPLTSPWSGESDRSGASSHVSSPTAHHNTTYAAAAARQFWLERGRPTSFSTNAASPTATPGTPSTTPLTFEEMEHNDAAAAGLGHSHNHARPGPQLTASTRVFSALTSPSQTTEEALPHDVSVVSEVTPETSLMLPSRRSHRGSSDSIAAAHAPALVTTAVTTQHDSHIRLRSPQSSSPAAASPSSSTLHGSFANASATRLLLDDSRPIAGLHNMQRRTSSRHDSRLSTRSSLRPSLSATPRLPTTPPLNSFASTGWMVVPPSLQLLADGAWRVGGYGRLYTVETRETLEERQSSWLQAEHAQHCGDLVSLREMYLSEEEVLERLWTWWTAHLDDAAKSGRAVSEEERTAMAALLRGTRLSDIRETVAAASGELLEPSSATSPDCAAAKALASLLAEVQCFLDENSESVELYSLPL